MILNINVQQITIFIINYSLKKNYLVYLLKKNQIIGIVSSGGFSSKFGFLNSLFEECKIRFNNGQNFFIVLIILINNLIKNSKKFFFNVYNAKEINQKNY